MDATLSFLVSAGVVTHLVDRHIEPRYRTPPRERDPPPQSLTPMHILGELALAVLGLIAGVVVLACEVCHSKYRRRRKVYVIKEHMFLQYLH